MCKFLKPPFSNPVILGIITVCCAAGFFVQSLSPEVAKRLTAEDGPFELASAALYGCAFLLAAWQTLRNPTALRVCATAMAFWATLRELDFQKRFTYRSIESVGYYSRPIAPLSEKLIVLLVLLPFAIAGAYLVWNYWKRLPGAFRAGENWVCYTFGVILLMSISSFLEKILRFGAAEEVCESGVALMVLLLVWETRPRVLARPEPPLNQS